jgi:hypothetical protein
MTSLLEFNARAALCRQLARLEPDSKNLWLAEAERWSRLKHEPEAATRLAGPADAWCWNVISKRRDQDIKITDVQFKLRHAGETAGGDAFEELLTAMLPEAGEPN